MRRNQGHHAVAAEPKPVHPVGQPISASTKRGFSVRVSAQPGTPAFEVSGTGWKDRFTACSLRGRLLRARVAGLAWPLFQSRAEGVAQQRARSVRSADLRLPALGRFPSQAFGVGHGEDEQPLAAMRSADLRRREQSFRNPETHSFQVAADLAISEVEVVGNVLQENKSGLALANDAGDVRPQVPGIVSAAPFSCNRKWLARIPRQQDVHRATPWSAVEAGKLVPDRSRRQGLVRHPRREDGRGKGVPLDMTHSAISGLGDVQAEIEAAGAGTQGQAEQGPSATSAWGGM